MAENSAIEWTDHSWNWAQGCPKNNDSQELACKNCYMYREKSRYGQNPAVVVRSAKLTFNFPLISKKLKPGDKIFTCSWEDFFNEALDPWREETWDIIRQTPQYIYQILTKWPENIKDRLPADWGNGWPNVWSGVTVENQEMADKRIPILLQIPAAVRFVSVEPMLNFVDLQQIRIPQEPHAEYHDSLSGYSTDTPIGYIKNKLSDPLSRGKLDWVICGPETGPGKRPMKNKWILDLYRQCTDAGVPFFDKKNVLGLNLKQFPEVPK
jgi:protein gp37